MIWVIGHYFGNNPYRYQTGNVLFVGLERCKQRGEVVNNSFHNAGFILITPICGQKREVLIINSLAAAI